MFIAYDTSLEKRGKQQKTLTFWHIIDFVKKLHVLSIYAFDIQQPFLQPVIIFLNIIYNHLKRVRKQPTYMFDQHETTIRQSLSCQTS